jgi:hypothetical protein
MLSAPNGPNSFGHPPVISSNFSKSSGEHKKASVLPLIVALLTLVASIAIQVFQFQLGNNLWYYIGYLLTPLAITMVLGWDSIAQRSGRRDPWFEAKPIYSKTIRVLVALGFAVAVLHIVAIGIQIGEQVVQSGVTI